MSKAKSSQNVSAAQHLHRRLTLALAGMTVLGIVLALIWKEQTATADALSCGITEITFTSAANNSPPSISGDGKWIAFVSAADLTGGNSDHNSELFLFDTTTNTFRQLTDATVGGSESPSINADGTHIAFSSNSDLSGSNADGNFEIFLYDTTTANFTQVTNSSGGSNWEPSINADGTRITFDSSCDLFPGFNADGNFEMFLYDATTTGLTQFTITTGGGGNQEPSINADGTLIAFVSDRDLIGGNANGNPEIFLFNSTTLVIAQVTNTTGVGNGEPSINADGTRIAFMSQGFPGGNPDGSFEIFLYDAATGGISEITFTAAGTANKGPSINGDGTRIAFVSPHDFTGGNSDHNVEIFLYDTTTNNFTQVTDTTGSNFGTGANDEPSISRDGTRIAFRSTRFADLGNADGNQDIFLASCVLPPPPAQADLLLSQSADKTSVKQGDTLTYTVTVKNFGPDNAANVVINDTLSSGATFVSAHASKGNFTAPPVGQTGTVTWGLGTVSNGEQDAAQISVTVIIRGKTTITNKAIVSSEAQDPNPDNNSTSLSTTVQAGSGGGGKK